MSASFGRVAAVLLGLLLGGLAGGWIGHWRQAVPIGAGIGAVIGVTAMALADAARAARFLRWMRGNQDTAAPRDTGFWGEVGYRVERALRMREREIVAERERLSQFLEAIEASPNGVLLVDADDRIEWCNARAADHFGLSPARDRRQKVTNLLRAPNFVAHLAAGEFDLPVEVAGPQGQMHLSVLVRPYGDGQKLILSHDITERERMETMRRDFVANVSHEIRTPLTVLAGFVETLASVPLSSSEQPRVFALMRQQTSRIQTLVDDLLTLAQLEGSPRPAADRWINSDAVIATAMADAELLSAGRQDLHIDRVRGVEIAGAEAEVVSAMGNLLSNAVRYTPEGGRIDVRWSVRDSDGSAVFEVADTGIGIAREHLPRLTERFYRVDGSRSRDTGGTGLGLAIVKHVVQRHGGELQVESEPGKGSRFRLVFPALRVRVREDAAATQPGTDRQSA